MSILDDYKIEELKSLQHAVDKPLKISKNSVLSIRIIRMYE